MKHAIIGTAGHVDHGKTALIKALTGIDTDRLIEEKKRGITIELGFAHLDFDDGTQAGIVDVPGHEKFIKNMLAGAGGIDLAMLVVAADEGFMPQTVEHLDILSLLGIRDGLVVITKCDAVDPGWVDVVREDVAAHVKGTFLEGKRVMAVSSYTGEGIRELRAYLNALVHSTSAKNLRAPFRLPIDRVFSVDGFGTVVTGTLIEGTICEGDMAAILPGGTEARVRNLQVHGRDVATAYAGQRVAVNLAGIKKDDLSRGSVIAKPGSVRTSLMLDVHLQNLTDSHRTILHGSQVHLYHGSTQRLAKVVLLDRDALNPGESCYAQLRLGTEIAAKCGDRFVIRFYSPMETIGGGTVLDDRPIKHKRGDKRVLETLSVKESGSDGDKLMQIVAEYGHAMPTPALLSTRLCMEQKALGSMLNTLCAQGKLLELLPGRYLTSGVFDSIWSSCRALLEQYHTCNPLHSGMKIAELRQKLLRNTEQSVTDAILAALAREGRIRFVADRCAMADFSVRLTKRQSIIQEKVLRIYRTAGLDIPRLDEVCSAFSKNEQSDCRQVAESLIAGGELVLLAPQLCVHHTVYADICKKTKVHFAENCELTLAQFRDLLGTSRKTALTVLEHFDRNRILIKDGDIRRPGSGL